MMPEDNLPALAPAASDPIGQEIASLRDIARESPDGYDEPTSARHLALLEARQAVEGRDADLMADLPWRAQEIMGVLSTAERDDLAGGFVSMVPEAARAAVGRELSRGAGGLLTRACTEDDIATFREDRVGAAMLREWGSDAWAKIPVVYARMQRVVRGMSPDDRQAFVAWLCCLSPAEEQSIMRAIVRAG